MRNSSWLSGCQSWYLNADGTNSTMWPGFSFEYVLRVRKMDMSAYNVVSEGSVARQEWATSAGVTKYAEAASR
jgi:hypothetical protein